MLTGPLQFQGQYNRESYTRSTNQITYYWITYGVQEVREKDSSLLACTFHSDMQVFT